MTEQVLQPQNEHAQAQYRVAQNDFNILKMRLDTQPLLDQIELFLRGARWTIEQTPNGDIQSKKIILGTPKANDLGIQSILSWLTSTINPHTVQGNFPVDKHGFSQMYESYIYEFQLNLGKYMVLHCYDWEVEDEEIEGIIDFIMNTVKAFMSRPIGNQERKSYAKTMESKETHMIGGKGVPTFKS